MSKRIIVLVQACLMMLSVFTGCGQKAADQNTTAAAAVSASDTQAQTQEAAPAEKKISGEVSFMTYRDDLLNSWYPKVFDEFKAKYPDVTITTSTSKNFASDVKIKMASNDLPDVITLSMADYNMDQKSQYLMTVEEYAPEMLADWEGLDSSKNIDGTATYGLTYGLNTYGLIYNKKIFTDLGLMAPKTFDELLAAGQKIKAAGKIGLAGCMKPGWTFSVYTVPLPNIMDENFKADQKQMAQQDAPFTADGPYGKTFEMIKKLADAKIYEDDPASYDWEPMKKDFAAGKTGMYYGWSNMLSQLPGDGSVVSPSDLGFVPFPYDNSGSYKAVYEADWDLCISKTSKNLDAAKALYFFLMNDKYSDYIKATGVLSARKSVKVDNAAINEFEAANPTKVFSTGDDPDFKAVNDKAKLDIAGDAIKVALGKELNSVLTEMNDAWKKARATK